MATYHLVAFKFKPDGAPHLVKTFLDNFMALKDNCLTLQGQKYIRSIVAGKQNSPEGHDRGMEVSFLVVFESADDRDYYVKEDKVHLAFATNPTNGSFVADLIVLDFTEGQF